MIKCPFTVKIIMLIDSIMMFQIIQIPVQAKHGLPHVLTDGGQEDQSGNLGNPERAGYRRC